MYLVEITTLCLLQKYGKNPVKLIVLVTAFSYLIENIMDGRKIEYFKTCLDTEGQGSFKNNSFERRRACSLLTILSLLHILLVR